MFTYRTLVIGAGSWGTALATLASLKGEVLLWSRDCKQVEAINSTHHNPSYLSEFPIRDRVRGTCSFEEAKDFLTGDADGFLVILALPVAGMRDGVIQWSKWLPADIPIVWTCKGFESDTGLLPHEIIAKESGFTEVGVLSGPSFAKEVIQGLPVALTVATASDMVIEIATNVLHNGSCRVYGSSDVVGVEVGGALKNIIAIACGISDGLGLGLNARAALITRGLTEMSRLGVAMGALHSTFYGLTGMGDLVLTATGDLSRNRQVGLAIASGRSLEDILSSGLTAEGVRCAQITLSKANELGVALPITEAVCDVLFGGVQPLDAVRKLLIRDAKSE
ncbi:NAD(P)H-dependent glycerol-3-phosphate dehydrogenase [Taylorella equigenitalis]|uniref:Glycerol-3-phosphate dehydrogenase [NAD(P)+] n=1 Tax=Taylorella equigenitalis (strain MCE9) TaxID=937774 RepID=A0A654KH01_TAYEM|nr:NAD(P)H-dependent glycerol-3-phosphate dehydrogenase [Taylorella equigenitalis]ADU91679.1 Glycerol-3-phosphate dehydrogenase [NAD(P)+] [Taylorella equigenitalis MCE9]WDU57080.1 NAD(P)-dependent glycerol-3-phosphate dehydrogenase [Taylorella equigenitalis]